MIESENINVLNKIYDILNDEFKKKNTKLSKVKFYRAIFFDEFGNRDDSHYFHKFKHIKNFNGNDFEEITCAFQSQNGNGEMKYFNRIFKEIDKKELNEFKAVCKSRLINECYCDIVDLNNFSLEEIIVILLCYYIEQIREPIEIEEKIICEGRDKEFERMEESISNKNFAIVCGYTKTGKTEFVEKYLQDNDYMMLYYDYSCNDYNSYDKIINNIPKGNYVVEFLKSIGRISELDFSKRIKLLKESNQACKKAIVIDNFRDSIGGENNEANKYFKLSEEYDVVFILINDVADDQWQKEIYLSHFISVESLERIFYSINAESKGIEIARLVSEIAKSVNGYPCYMREIAEYYKFQCLKNNDNAFKALKEVNKMLNSDINKLSLDMKYRSSHDDSQIKLSGHLKKIYDGFLSDCDKKFLLLIVFLNKLVIDLKYVQDWTGIEIEMVNKFLDIGWFRAYKNDKYQNRQLIYVNFPSPILLIYFSGLKINDKCVSDAICRFMDVMSNKLNFEELVFINKTAFYSIIKAVHNFCTTQFDKMEEMKNKAKNGRSTCKIKEKVKNSFLIFHINSIRYCYKMNMISERITLIDNTDKYYAELNFKNHDFFIKQIQIFEQKYDIHDDTFQFDKLENFSKTEFKIYQLLLKDRLEYVWQNFTLQYSNILRYSLHTKKLLAIISISIAILQEFFSQYRKIVEYIRKRTALSAEFEELNKQYDALYELLCISIEKFEKTDNNADLICVKNELKAPLLYINKKLCQQYILPIEDINPYTLCFLARAATFIQIWLKRPSDYITKSYFQNLLRNIIHDTYSKLVVVEGYIHFAISQEIRMEIRNISETGLVIKDFYSTED